MLGICKYRHERTLYGTLKLSKNGMNCYGRSHLTKRQPVFCTKVHLYYWLFALCIRQWRRLRPEIRIENMNYKRNFRRNYSPDIALILWNYASNMFQIKKKNQMK